MENHCRDCCCARSWKALGISKNTGKSIVEHIELLKREIIALRLENESLDHQLQDTQADYGELKAQIEATILAGRYSYQVVWSQEDDEYVATCEAWPYLSWLATEHDEALDGLIKLVASEIRRTILKTGE